MKVLSIAAATAAFYGVSIADLELDIRSKVIGLPDCSHLFIEESFLTSEAVFECEVRNVVDIIQGLRINVSAG